MTRKRQSVELQTGAFRALLRQPDLPPDLADKIRARTEIQSRKNRLGDVRRALPVIFLALVTIMMAAALAFVIMPEARESPSNAVTARPAEPTLDTIGPNPASSDRSVPQQPSNAAASQGKAPPAAPPHLGDAPPAMARPDRSPAPRRKLDVRAPTVPTATPGVAGEAMQPVTQPGTPEAPPVAQAQPLPGDAAPETADPTP